MKLLRTVCRLLPLYEKKVGVREIDKGWCLDFIDWVRHIYKARWDELLSPKGAANYVGYFSTALNATVRAEVIPENPIMALATTEHIKVPESKREYLAIDEIRVLIDTECLHEDVERAHLSICYCGLRLSDVYALRWEDTVQDGGRCRMSIVIQKATTPIHLPPPCHVVRWLPERNGAENGLHAFAELPAEPNISKVLAKWTATAGVNKKITHHTSHHTLATIVLTLGTGLYTTSKLLGHANVETTQIYTRVVDSREAGAVDLADNVSD